MGAFYLRCAAQKARPIPWLVFAQTRKVLPSRIFGTAQDALPNSTFLAAFAATSSLA
jgi:hypothetical protein